jgi:hypothetical protein
MKLDIEKELKMEIKEILNRELELISKFEEKFHTSILEKLYHKCDECNKSDYMPAVAAIKGILDYKCEVLKMLTAIEINPNVQPNFQKEVK